VVFGLALALEGRREPVTWLQRHPLIYPMFRHPHRPFGTPPPFSQKMGEAGRGLGVSAPFARGNLHLVISPVVE